MISKLTRFYRTSSKSQSYTTTMRETNRDEREERPERSEKVRRLLDKMPDWLLFAGWITFLTVIFALLVAYLLIGT